MKLLQCVATQPRGGGRSNCCNAPPQCLGALGSASAAVQCHSNCAQWAVEVVQCTFTLLHGRRKYNCCNAMPHCTGVVGRGFRARHRQTTRR